MDTHHCGLDSRGRTHHAAAATDLFPPFSFPGQKAINFISGISGHDLTRDDTQTFTLHYTRLFLRPLHSLGSAPTPDPRHLTHITHSTGSGHRQVTTARRVTRGDAFRGTSKRRIRALRTRPKRQGWLFCYGFGDPRDRRARPLILFPPQKRSNHSSCATPPSTLPFTNCLNQSSTVSSAVSNVWLLRRQMPML